jgi:hypothetical protein
MVFTLYVRGFQNVRVADQGKLLQRSVAFTDNTSPVKDVNRGAATAVPEPDPLGEHLCAISMTTTSFFPPIVQEASCFIAQPSQRRRSSRSSMIPLPSSRGSARGLTDPLQLFRHWAMPEEGSSPASARSRSRRTRARSGRRPRPGHHAQAGRKRDRRRYGAHPQMMRRGSRPPRHSRTDVLLPLAGPA